MGILIIDIGTSGVRAGVVNRPGALDFEIHAETLPATPEDGIVEFDALAYTETAIGLAREVLTRSGPVDAVGISNQRASAIVWDRSTGDPVAPAQSWQDLRTLGDCLVLQAENIRFAPNMAATKYANILNAVDPNRERDLCVGTPDSYLIWRLTEGASHTTDVSNGALTGLMSLSDRSWRTDLCQRLDIPAESMPEIRDSSGFFGQATVLDGAPPILGVAGDQQASMIGQSCVTPGLTKITFGTGAMLDQCTGTVAPAAGERSEAGTFPIAAWSRDGEITWGTEALMLSAGTNVAWLRDDLKIIETVASSEQLAAQCNDTDGVLYVPAQLGIGTPHWDYGARSLLVGVTRGTGAAEITRAVLEGVAHRGVDLIEATESDTSLSIGTLRVDGGMSDNAVFVQALANLSNRRVEVAPITEATALGAAYLAGLEIGTFDDWSDIAEAWNPRVVIDPEDGFDAAAARTRWNEAVSRSLGWHPDLSALDF